jgi:hypothetical protein
LGEILLDLEGKREILQIKENHPLVAEDEDLEGIWVSLSGLFDKKPVIHELCSSPSIILYILDRQRFPVHWLVSTGKAVLKAEVEPFLTGFQT